MNSGRLSLLDLPWLQRPHADFRQRLATLTQTETGDWAPGLTSLAKCAFGLNQAVVLSRALRQRRSQRPQTTLIPFRLGLISHATVDLIVPCLEATALRYGIDLEVVSAPFGQPMQAALDPASMINACRPDAVLLALDHRGLPFQQAGSGLWPPFQAGAARRNLDAMRDGLQQHSRTVCLVQTVPALPAPLFGHLDVAIAGSLRFAVAEFNAELARDASGRGDVLIDVDLLAQSVGLDTWHNERDWHLARLPFNQRALPLYADHIVRAIAALRGLSRKCLVLDLDNTIWGGVIGDDGLEGIALNQGDARGEAYRSVQATALDLRRRGVILAVCSKNEEAIARMPFRQHAGMLFKEDDIAVFIANWDDKATNLERIAQRLDIGLDALVLLDDNPAERSQVRQALPQVAVPELGDDPSDFSRLLLQAGYFESVAFTAEDLARAEQYRGNAQRADLMNNTRDISEFLRSLDMRIQFAPFQPQGRKRITQLINKTHQFNLTTRRFTEAQVADLEVSALHHTLQVGLVDRFGDNGMISVLICRRDDEQWEIDVWLMSCRVLNRRVERAVCNRIALAARADGARRLVGLYGPTPRNQLVAGLYADLGFVREASPDDAQRWVLDLEAFLAFDVPISDAT